MHPWMRASGCFRVLRPRESCIADASGRSALEERGENEKNGKEPYVSMGTPWYAPVRFSTVNGGPLPRGKARNEWLASPTLKGAKTPF